MPESQSPTPEMPTDPEWRALMKRERKRQGFTQGTLASALGTSQATISAMENGTQAGSKWVLAVCRKLSIPPPMMYEDELDRRWVEAGRRLRPRGMPMLLHLLGLAEAFVRAAPDPDGPANPDPAAPQ